MLTDGVAGALERVVRRRGDLWVSLAEVLLPDSGAAGSGNSNDVHAAGMNRLRRVMSPFLHRVCQSAAGIMVGPTVSEITLALAYDCDRCVLIMYSVVHLIL